jgi:hypothetical protein
MEDGSNHNDSIAIPIHTHNPAEIKTMVMTKKEPVPRVATHLPSWNTDSMKTIRVANHSQLDILARILAPQCESDITPECVIAFTEIRRKQQGYISQDKKKKRPFSNPFLIFDIIRLMHDSGMVCHYCTQPVYVLYESKLHPSQWTLDRKDNTRAHDLDNVFISCLACNLKRRTQNARKFKESKTFTHVRMIE